MGQLNVTFDKKQLILNHEGENLLNGMTIEEKAFYLTIANSRLETDIDTSVGRIKDLDDGHFLWILTWFPIRLDDLEGMIAWYYLFSLIEGLYSRVLFSSISLSHHFPSYLRNYIEHKTNIPTKKQSKPIHSLKKAIRDSISPLKVLYHVCKYKGHNVQIAPGHLWLATDSNYAIHRYRTFLDHLKIYRKAYFHNFHTRDILNRLEGDDNLNFSPFFKVKDLFSIAKRSFVLKRATGKIRTPYLLAQFFKNIRFSQLTIMMLREVLVGRAMKEYPPQAIFLTTANTYPPARLVTRQANLHGIPTVVVACRSMFTNLRPEERTCQSDLIPIHHAKIADYFVVWDLFSKNTLVDQGISKNRIFVHQVNPYASVVRTFVLRSALLVILSDEEQNEKLIGLLEKIKIVWDLRIAIKTHPAVKLRPDQLKRILRFIPEVIDVSSYKMHEIRFIDVIAVSINSSAVVEACSYGCGIIWVPYLNERAIIFYSVMKVLGWNFSSEKDFLDALQTRLNLPELRDEFIAVCQESYNRHFMTEDTIDELLPLLNLNA